jgi:hypothetical protein
VAHASVLVHPNARLTRVLTASAGETIRNRDGSAVTRRPSVLSPGTRALLIEILDQVAEIQPLDGPHEGERLLLLAENLDV